MMIKHRYEAIHDVRVLVKSSIVFIIALMLDWLCLESFRIC